MEPDFYNDMEKAGKIMQKIKGLQGKIRRYEELKGLWEDLTMLVELAIEKATRVFLMRLKMDIKLCVKTLRQ